MGRGSETAIRTVIPQLLPLEGTAIEHATLRLGGQITTSETVSRLRRTHEPAKTGRLLPAAVRHGPALCRTPTVGSSRSKPAKGEVGMAYQSKERPPREIPKPRPDDFKGDKLGTKIRDLLLKKADKRGLRS
jgi:hypothetical protein